MKTSGLGLAMVVSLIMSASMVTGCGDTPSTEDDAPAAKRTVEGAVSKGPISGATVSAYLIDATGFPSGDALATATTDASGGFTLQLGVVEGAVLVVSSGGSYLDESDPAGQRRIALSAGQGLMAVLPAGASSVSLTPFSDAVVRRARRLSSSGRFVEIYQQALQQAITAFGLNPVTTVPANPVNPAAGASTDSQRYAVLLGGFANVVNSVSIRFGRAAPDFALVDTLIDDLSDGLDGLLDGERIGHSVGGAELLIPTDISINNAIARFRNNQHDSYPSLTAPQIAGASAFTPIVLPNDAPVAGDDAYSVLSGGELSVAAPGVLLNDSDPDGDTVTVALVSGPAHGTLSLAGDGSFTYVHDGASTISDSFTYSLTDPAGDSAQATVTITIGALPSFSVTDTSVVEGQGPLVFAVNRGSDPAMAVGAASVPYTVTAGTASAADVSLAGGTLQFADGEATAQISLAVINDAIYELTETVTVILGTPELGSLVDAQAVGSIQNDDPLPVIAVQGGDVLESAGSAVVTISRTGATEVPTSGSAATVPGTATAGTDFVAIAPTDFVLPAGANSATLTVIINDDSADEPNETFGVLLSSLQGGAGADGSSSVQGTVTIVDDDEANTAPIADPASLTVTSGQSVSGQLAASDADGDALTFRVGTPPTHGSVNIANNGNFSYSSNTGFVGTDEFTFLVNDGIVDSAPATVTIGVRSGSVVVQTNTGALIPMGTWHAIRSTELRASQIGTSTGGLSYSITNNFAWKVYRKGTMTPVTSFTQAQVDAGQVAIATDAENFSPSGATGGTVAKAALRYPMEMVVQGANGAQTAVTFNVDVRDDAEPVSGTYNEVAFELGFARERADLFGGTGRFTVGSALQTKELAVVDTAVTVTSVSSAANERFSSLGRTDTGTIDLVSDVVGTLGGDVAEGTITAEAVATFPFGYEEVLSVDAFDRRFPHTVQLLPLNPLGASWAGVDGENRHKAFDSDGDGQKDALYALRPPRGERRAMFSTMLSAESAAGVLPVEGDYGVVSLLLALNDDGSIDVDTRYLEQTFNSNAVTAENGGSATFTRQLGSSGPAALSTSALTPTAPVTTITQGVKGTVQFPYDFDLDGASDLTYSGAMNDRRTFFAATGGASETTTVRHALTLGVLRPASSAQTMLAAQTFRIRGLELAFNKSDPGSSLLATGLDQLVFSADGSTVTFMPATEGRRQVGRSGLAVDAGETATMPSSPSGAVTYGSNGMLSFVLNGRTFTGFAGADGDQMVLSLARDDTAAVGAGLWLATRDVAVSTNAAPSFLIPAKRASGVIAKVTSNLPGTATIVPNGQPVMLTATATDDTTVVDANYTWFASAGSFEDTAGNATTQGANIVWVAPATGDGRTILTVQYSDGEYAAVDDIVIAWGADSDGDQLVNTEETEITMTDPDDPDTDNDFVDDGTELVEVPGTSPIDPDSDGDDVPDGPDPNPTDNTTEDTIYVNNGADACVSGCDGTTWATAWSLQSEVLADLGTRAATTADVFVIYKGNTGTDYGTLELDSTVNTLPSTTIVLVSEPAAVTAKVHTAPTPTVTFAGDGMTTARPLKVFDSAVAAYGIAMTNGAGVLLDTSEPGGGVTVGNSMGNSAFLELVGVKIHGNTADLGGGLGLAGDNTSVVVRSSQIVENVGQVAGGGIYADGNLQVYGSRIADNGRGGNTTMLGGGIYIGHYYAGSFFPLSTGASVNIADSTIQRNQSHGDGGGIAIFKDPTDTGSSVTISDSQILGNTAGDLDEFGLPFGGNGGGIAVIDSPPMSVTLQRLSVLNNAALDDGTDGGDGGGILIGGSTFSSVGGSASIMDSEIAGNTGQYAGGGVVADLSDGAPVAIVNNRVVGNAGFVGGGGVMLYDLVPTDGSQREVFGNTIAFNEVQSSTSGVGAGLELSADPGSSSVLVDVRYNAVFNNDDGDGQAGGSSQEATTNICISDGLGGCLALALSSFDYNATGDTSTGQPSGSGNLFALTAALFDRDLRLDQISSPLVDAGLPGDVSTCDPDNFLFTPDCTTAADGTADFNGRDIGVHYAKPAPGPLNDLFDAPAVQADATAPCASVIVIPVNRAVPGDPSSPAQFLNGSEPIRVRVTDTTGTHSDKFVESLIGFDPVSDGQQGVLAQSVALGQFEFRVCASGNCPSASTFSNIPLEISDLGGNSTTTQISFSACP